MEKVHHDAPRDTIDATYCFYLEQERQKYNACTQRL